MFKKCENCGTCVKCKWLPLIARILMGIIFTGSGLYGFISNFAFPPDLPESMMMFVKGMQATTYFFPLLKGTEIICGLMLLSGYFVPLALVILAPIIINVFCVHLFLAPQGLPIAIIIGLLEIYLAFCAKQYSHVICPLFCKRKN